MVRVLVDMDSTIADWGKEYDRMLDEHDEKWAGLKGIGCKIPRTKDQVAFNLKAGMNGHQSETIDKIMNDPGFYLRLEPIPGAIEKLKEMVIQGHEVILVTSPWLTNPTCISDKFAWVEKYLGKEWTERLIITKDKTHVAGDILIDDKPEIKGTATPSWEHVLFVQPYNLYVADKRVIENWTSNEVWDILHSIDTQIVEAATVTREYAKSDKFVKGTEVRSVSSTGGEKGTKDERFDLIPIGALTQLAQHFGVGARKYADNQWRKGYEWSKSYAALQRHATQFWNGEDFDSETGSNHMAAVAWHAFTLLTFFDEFPQFDDRYKVDKEVSK
jgi:5'-nucleotidase